MNIADSSNRVNAYRAGCTAGELSALTHRMGLSMFSKDYHGLMVANVGDINHAGNYYLLLDQEQTNDLNNREGTRNISLTLKITPTRPRILTIRRWICFEALKSEVQTICYVINDNISIGHHTIVPFNTMPCHVNCRSNISTVQ